MSRIRLMTTQVWATTRLTSGFVQEPSCPPIGGNDSPSTVSHSRPIFTSSWHSDSEMAVRRFTTQIDTFRRKEVLERNGHLGRRVYLAVKTYSTNC